MLTTDPLARQHLLNERASSVAVSLRGCLDELDALDQGLAAVHVSMALELLKEAYGLEA